MFLQNLIVKINFGFCFKPKNVEPLGYEVEWVSEWPCMREGETFLLILICVVKGFVPKLLKRKIVNV